MRTSTAAKANREYEQLKKELQEAEEADRKEQSRLRAAYILGLVELEAMPKMGRPSKRKLELTEYLKALADEIGPLDLPAGHMSVELLPEHKALISEYERLRNSDDPDKTAMKEAAQRISDALDEAENAVNAGKRRGKPKAKMQKRINFISLFRPVHNKWNASGKRGRLRKERLTPEHQQQLDEHKARVAEIKGSKHALGHRPERCTDSQRDKIKLIENSYPDLYRAYQLKEALRLIMHMKDPELAAVELDKWICEASTCEMRSMKELSEKISRHRTNILNSVRHQANSAKSESANTTIKALIKVARGFRNTDNLIAMIYLKCSDLVIPLNNRYQPSREEAAKMREHNNELRRRREELKRQQYLEGLA